MSAHYQGRSVQVFEDEPEDTPPGSDALSDNSTLVPSPVFWGDDG